MIRLLLILLLLPNLAISQTLYLGKKSKHFNGEEYRESHPLIMFEKSQYLIGWWRNSYDRNTFAVGYQYPIQQTIYFEYGLRVGVLTGYATPVFGTIYFDHQNLSCDATYPVIACGLRFHF